MYMYLCSLTGLDMSILRQYGLYNQYICETCNSGKIYCIVENRDSNEVRLMERN